MSRYQQDQIILSLMVAISKCRMQPTSELWNIKGIGVLECSQSLALELAVHLVAVVANMKGSSNMC